MLARSTRRLAGFRFEAQAPPLAEALPRMDVAIFVGFAACGPIETPVAVESSEQFDAIFGADAPLAWDARRGTQVYAYLAPAVRAFFRNGGVRCWVVRLARRKVDPEIPHNLARTNYFPLPGLLRAQFNADGRLTGFQPASARARAEGSWSDSLRVATALQVRPMQLNQIVKLSGPEPIFDLDLASVGDLKTGDLLRFQFERDGYQLLVGAKTIEPAPESSPPSRLARRRTVRITGTMPVWCRRFAVNEFSPPDDQVTATTYTFEPTTNFGANTSPEGEQSPDFATSSSARVRRAVIASPPTTADDDDAIEQELVIDLDDAGSSVTSQISAADTPQPGSLVRLDFAEPASPLTTRQVWMTVENVAMQRRTGTSREFARLTGKAVEVLSEPPPALPSEVSAIEALTFELRARQADEYAISLSDLGFHSQHERFWADLPSDAELYSDEPPETSLASVGAWTTSSEVARFPLAGYRAEAELFFPIAMSALADQSLRPVRLPGTTLERDGLASFDADLFLDEALIGSNLENFLSDYEFVRYLSATPRALHGMHCAVGLYEATIVAVPDAVHRGWRMEPEDDPTPAKPVPPLPRPEWWHFLDCKEEQKTKQVSEPNWSEFLNCSTRIIEPPAFSGDSTERADQSGTFSLSWSFDETQLRPNESAVFILEESGNADFSGARTIYEGPARNFTLYGRRAGDYYYHVRAALCCESSNWSGGKAVRVGSPNRWRVRQGEYLADILLAVQRSLLRMCAGRGDLFGLLSLPEHYREADALNHVSVLKLTPEQTPPTSGVAALGYGEARAYSYAALYHPWLVGREESRFDELRRTPPCGAAAGLLARRANARGAWIAPANEKLSEVVSLFPPILAEHYRALQQAQINLIQQEPAGFLTLNADTLSDDGDFRPINVRRLLILLRRMALRLGAKYVFEPHSDTFRRLVSRGFNAMLDGMFVRGAFAGRTPATSFQVVTDESLNTRQSTEQGRFIVELRVAPSLPMTFLTVRLVQTGDFGFVTEGRG